MPVFGKRVYGHPVYVQPLCFVTWKDGVRSLGLINVHFGKQTPSINMG